MTTAKKVPRGTKDGKGFKPGVELARQAFVYGLNGEFITSTPELAKLGNVSEATIWKYTKQWQSEREELLARSSKVGVSGPLSVPNEVIDAHKDDILYIRQRLDKTKSELSALPDFIQDLRKMIADCAGEPDQIDKMMQLLDRYLRLCANEKSLTKLFMDLKQLWDAKSGVDSLKNIQEATAKAVSIASAKSDPGESKADEPKASGGVFRLG